MTGNATTRETIERYFHHLENRGDWRSLLADDVTFTSRTNPGRQIDGREGYVQATGRFFGMIVGAEVRDILVDGRKACALTRYRLQPPNGGAVFESDVAEIFTVRDGLIDSLAIYFDTAPYPR
jgi:ketosteroid isomerase-like protein